MQCSLCQGKPNPDLAYHRAKALYLLLLSVFRQIWSVYLQGKLAGSVQKLNISWATQVSLSSIAQPEILFWLDICNLVMKIIMYICLVFGIITLSEKNINLGLNGIICKYGLDW